MVHISIDTLTEVTLIVLEKQGYPTDEAQTILEVLLYAQLRGNNQGIVKLIGAGMPRDPNCTPMRIVHETKLSALIDGGRHAGMVAMRHALDVAIGKARDHGFAIVGTHNTNTSTGAIGYYAQVAAQTGMIGVVFAGSGEYVAMHGSYQPMMGTNPLAIAIPTGGRPVVFDMATSAIARFGIVEAKAAGRPIPPDVAYDSLGKPTTDAAAALTGAIRTFGGYKGAGLSFIVEILTGALVETSRTEDGHKIDWGTLSLVIDPELLTDRGSFEHRVGELIARVKNSLRLPDVDDILIPGERGNRILEKILREDEIEIDDALWEALVKQTA